MLAIDTAGNYPEIQLLYTGSMTPGEICYKVSWLATINHCVVDSPENLLSLLKRLTLMTSTTKVILSQSHWEVYWLAFLCRRGAAFLTQTFLFCPYSIAILGIFWLSRWNWSIGYLQIILFLPKKRHEGELLILELLLESISAFSVNKTRSVIQFGQFSSHSAKFGSKCILHVDLQF